MSKKEFRRRELASRVMKEAHRLYKRGEMFLYNFSTSLKLAWKTIRGLCKFNYDRAKGVSFSNSDGVSRQAILKALSKYHKGQVSLYFVREPNNPYDPSAIKIMAKVVNKGIAQIGYLTKGVAKEVSSEFNSGKVAVVILEGITGGDLFNYGLHFSYVLV